MPVYQRRAFLASGLALAAAGRMTVKADDLRGQRPEQDAAAKVSIRGDAFRSASLSMIRRAW